jgi:very-short-patch-repair endonuclease
MSNLEYPTKNLGIYAIPHAQIKYTCKYCKKEFYCERSAKRKFCSNDCYWKWLSIWRRTHNNFLGKKHTEEWKVKISKIMSEINKKRWQNSEYRERLIKAILKVLRKRPTSLEKRFIEFIKKYNLPFAYCGDGSLLIGHKNPDFYETNGRKICIEVRDEFFRKPENYEQERIEHFAKYGWKCIVIWDKELKNEVILRDKLECLYSDSLRG